MLDPNTVVVYTMLCIITLIAIYYEWSDYRSPSGRYASCDCTYVDQLQPTDNTTNKQAANNILLAMTKYQTSVQWRRMWLVVFFMTLVFSASQGKLGSPSFVLTLLVLSYISVLQLNSYQLFHRFGPISQIIRQNCGVIQ